jgi:aminoglycoside phosphotransferase (APT) family kinase protein
VGNLKTNPLALAALATAAVPSLDVVGARMDHVGADYAFAHVEDASGRTWVVRLALHAAAEAGQEAEAILLKSLAGASSGGALPFEVPRPRGHAALVSGGKAMVYAALPGAPVVMELMDAGPGVAESLGRAIGAFHELPPSIVTDAGLPAYTPSEHRARLNTQVDDAVRTGHVSKRLERRWREQLGRDAWWVFTPVPIHGDMAAEHLLENAGRVSAVTDFASVQVSDPAEDLAQLLAPLPPDVAGSIVGAYRRRRAELDDPHLEDRAAFLGEIAIIRWLRHGISLEDPAIIADARGMLADLDQAVEQEEAEAARLAAAEAAATAKLEAAKQAAEAETRQRREAALRASEAAAREHLRTSGSIPRVTGEDRLPDWQPPAEAKSEDAPSESAADGSTGDGTKAAEAAPPGGPDSLQPPKRESVAKGGVSLWGSPKKSSPGDQTGEAVPSWADQLDAAGNKEASQEVPPSEPAENGADGPDGAGGIGGAAGGPVPGDQTPAPADQPTDGDKDSATTDRAPASDPADQAEPDSSEMTQAFLPDFLKDDSEAPADIAAAAANDQTEALERPAPQSSPSTPPQPSP